MPITVYSLRRRFWQELGETSPELAKLYRVGKRQNEYPADVRAAWVQFIDWLHRDGEISEAMAERATL